MIHVISSFLLYFAACFHKHIYVYKHNLCVY